MNIKNKTYKNQVKDPLVAKEKARFNGISTDAAIGNIAMRGNNTDNNTVNNPININRGNINNTANIASANNTGINRPILNLNNTDTELSRMQSDRFSQYEKPDYSKIQEDERSRVQSMIDATEGLYQENLAKIRKQGLEDLRGVSSRQVSSGLAGTPFKATKEYKQKEITNEKLRAEEDRRIAQVTNLMRQADDKAREQYNLDKQYYGNERDAHINYLKNKQTESINVLKGWASQGGAVSDLSESQLLDIKDKTGLDDFSLEVLVNTNKPQTDTKDIKYQTIGNKIIGYYFDDNTQQIKTFESEPLTTITNSDNNIPNNTKYKTQVVKYGDSTKILLVPEEFKEGVPIKDQIIEYNNLQNTGTEKQAAKTTNYRLWQELGEPKGDFNEWYKEKQQGVITKEDIFKMESSIRKELDSLLKSPIKSLNQFKIMITGLDKLNNDIKNNKNISPATQAILVTFQKILDPDSVVRQSEYGRSLEGQNLADKAKGLLDSMLKNGGTGVTVENLRNFVDMASKFAKNYEDQIVNFGLRTNNIIKTNNLDKNNIFTRDVLDIIGKNNIENLDDYIQNNPEYIDKVQEIQDALFEDSRIYPTDDEILEILQYNQENQENQDFNNEETTSVKNNIILGSRLAKVNNNMGNLRYVGQKGATQGEGGFARFNTPQEGYTALKNQIKLDSSRGHTLSSFINKYAPPIENDTNTYISQITKRLGVNENTKLSDIDLEKLAREMARKESSTIIT